MKKIVKLCLGFLVETLRPPSLIKLAYKAIIYQMKFGSSLLKTVVVAVLTDPIIFLVTAGILLWMYIDKILSTIRT